MRYLTSLGFLLLFFQSVAQSWDSSTSGKITYSGSAVGIGTTSPTGSISSNQTGLHILDDNVSYLSLESTAGSGKKYTLYSGTSGSLVFWDASTSTARGSIGVNGNWGIGTTSPSGKLHIQQANGNWGAGLRISDSGQNWDIQADQSGNRLLISKNSSSSSGIAIHNGNVGIGTSSPANGYKLHINDGRLQVSDNNDVNLHIGLNNTHTGGNQWNLLSFSDGSTYGPAGAFGIGIAGAAVDLSIIDNGNVGIGTTNPEFKLDVNGTLTSRGEMGIAHSNPGFLFNESDVTDKNWHMQVNGGDFKLFEVDDARATWSQKMVVKNGTGNVGIGTTSPDSKLHIRGSGEQSIKLWSEDSKSHIHLRKHNSSQDGKIIYHTDGRMSFNLDGSNAGGVDTNEFLTIINSGNVGIGTTTPTHKLEVNGTIRTKEVKVEASPWPDYVFSSDYELMPLEEIEKFIQSNHHLPEIPSAQEIEINGLQLGEMNRLLLQKIEELTLHTIRQEKMIESMQEEIKHLKEEK